MLAPEQPLPTPSDIVKTMELLVAGIENNTVGVYSHKLDDCGGTGYDLVVLLPHPVTKEPAVFDIARLYPHPENYEHATAISASASVN